jgi:hypothetical protein
MGGIDLSEVYHDVVTVLRMKTGWATETLDFWNEYELRFSPHGKCQCSNLARILFGDREDEGPEPMVDRQDRFQRLEAAQREKEGLPNPQQEEAQSPNGSRKGSCHRVSWINLYFIFLSTGNSFTQRSNSLSPQFPFTSAGCSVEWYVVSPPTPGASMSEPNATT